MQQASPKAKDSMNIPGQGIHRKSTWLIRRSGTPSVTTNDLAYASQPVACCNINHLWLTLISLVIVKYLAGSQDFQASPSLFSKGLHCFSYMLRFQGGRWGLVFLVASGLLQRQRRSWVVRVRLKSVPMFWSVTDTEVCCFHRPLLPFFPS